MGGINGDKMISHSWQEPKITHESEDDLKIISGRGVSAID